MKRQFVWALLGFLNASVWVQANPAQEAMDFAIAARRLYEQGNLDGALLGYTEAINLAQTTPEYYLERSRVKLHLGFPNRARVDLEIALTFDRTFGDAWLQLGKVLYSLADYDRALDTFTQALLQLGDDPDAWAWRGRCHLRVGNDDAAVRALQRALQLNVDDPEARLDLGRALAANGEMTNAVLELSRFIREFPDNADGYAARAQVYLQQALRDRDVEAFLAQAASDCERADRLKPNSPRILQLRLLLAVVMKDTPALNAAIAGIPTLRPADQAAVRLFLDGLRIARGELVLAVAPAADDLPPPLLRRHRALYWGRASRDTSCVGERAAMQYYLGIAAAVEKDWPVARNAWLQASRRPQVIEGLAARFFLDDLQH